MLLPLLLLLLLVLLVLLLELQLESLLQCVRFRLDAGYHPFSILNHPTQGDNLIPELIGGCGEVGVLSRESVHVSRQGGDARVGLFYCRQPAGR